MNHGNADGSIERHGLEDLFRKRRELSALEAQLTHRELELATLRAELRSFQLRYHLSVGWLYSRLEELKSRISETLASRTGGGDHAIWEEVGAAQARAQGWKEAAEVAGQAPASQRYFQPSNHLKALFREIARAVHPDLATDESEAELRHQLMAEANTAYARGDAEALREIFERWNRRVPVKEGKGETELDQVLRVSGQVRDRLREIESEILSVTDSDLYRLKVSVETAAAAGRDLLAEMKESLMSQIREAEIRLRELREVIP